MENQNINNTDFLNEVTKKLAPIARKQEIDSKYLKAKEDKENELLALENKLKMKVYQEKQNKFNLEKKTIDKIQRLSLYLSQQASIVELKIIKSNENIITEIEKISTTKCNRENKEVKNGEIIYSMKNDFSAWLTNPIKVLDHGEYIILEVPRAYKNQFNNFL